MGIYYRNTTPEEDREYILNGIQSGILVFNEALNSIDYTDSVEVLDENERSVWILDTKADPTRNKYVAFEWGAGYLTSLGVRYIWDILSREPDGCFVNL